MTKVLEKFSLAGKVALVTGASRGLGRAMAQALGEAGASVALVARGVEATREAAKELAEQGIRTCAVQADVTDSGQVESMVEQVTRELGPIDVLVNNAGISVAGRALETPDSAWREVLATNLDGVWLCSRAVGRQMVERGGGSIVNIGSMSAMIVNQPRWQPPYLASKAAVHQLTKALAAEWAPHGIRVNALAPGYFLTEMSPVDQPEYQPWCVEPAAMKRYGLPEELGPAVVFLASDASSFMTGSVMVIDGGFTLF
ncbi:SDR family oxidoreductase [Actinopolymorpha pittospori]|uniref:NAD(P)-dependent dehydrogenase (Short-subunit alcohol dehydrogenase family) n=1 Tax=Actinopolymorpha pittospori TaxID=648752 RepID=A0A927N5U1_9ACTN|nr:NAD(P)-dependent dehydrogenase (short-subunit alcohol dehydrogenase family) [Actinopolymorpha pittospori]